jgi:hypothetical protein
MDEMAGFGDGSVPPTCDGEDAANPQIGCLGALLTFVIFIGFVVGLVAVPLTAQRWTNRAIITIAYGSQAYADGLRFKGKQTLNNGTSPSTLASVLSWTIGIPLVGISWIGFILGYGWLFGRYFLRLRKTR